MKATISEIVSIRVALEQINKPEYTLQSALTKIEERIKQWADDIEIVSETHLELPHNPPATLTHDDIPSKETQP